MEEVALPIDDQQIWLGAAGFIAVLVHPKNEKQRDKFVNACKAMVFKKFGGGKFRYGEVNNSDMLAFRRQRDIDAVFEKANRIIIEKRMPAMFWAINLMFKNSAQVEMKDGSAFSIIKALQEKYPTPDPYGKGSNYNMTNAHSRIWAESKTVLHLVFALREQTADTYPNVDLTELILNPFWLPHAMQRAEEMRQLFPSFSHLQIQTDKMIRLVPECETDDSFHKPVQNLRNTTT